MKHIESLFFLFVLWFWAAACCGARPEKAPAAAKATDAAEQEVDVNAEANTFLELYLKEYAALEKKQTLSYWKAATSGKEEAFAAFAKAELALKTMHSDPERYHRILEYQEHAATLDQVLARCLEVAALEFEGNQLPSDLLKQMVETSTEIERLFNTYRAELSGKKMSNNDLVEALAESTDTEKRREIWQALKQVGKQVGPKLVALARLRNRAAERLGYPDFWEMRVRLQEHDPEQLMKIFEHLDELTEEPFVEVKRDLDHELAGRFGIEPGEMMPWHYDNPFFQDAPPSEKVDLDEFYENKPKEEIIEITRRFFADIGLPCDHVIERSDLYEREGKDQHAFCISINRGDDVRTLLNIKATARWMDTALHEEGHAIYYMGIDRGLPFNLREAAHIFTTEGIAMLFGALAKNPTWMIAYAGADRDRIREVEKAILEQRRREQLVFARWSMVMLHFEKSMYADPDQDLNGLWWDLVERYQMIPRPPDRDDPDWAAKPHFTIAPVYYHNYLMGELFASQLRTFMADMVGHQGPASSLAFDGRKEFGEFLREKIFAPGQSLRWPEFVVKALGEPLSPKYFAEEVRR